MLIMLEHKSPEVGGNNFDVGFAEGLQGLANLLSAMPAGYIAAGMRIPSATDVRIATNVDPG